MSAGDSNSPVFDFTSLDFASVSTDLTRYALSVFGNELWTDFNVHDQGSKLIRLKAYATDLVSYNQNSRVLETMIPTVIREQSMRNIGKSLDFTFKGRSPARTRLRFTVDAAFLPLAIPATHRVSSGSGVVFQPDVAVTAVAATVDVDATQGESVTNELLGVTDGTPNQQFVLGKRPLLDNTLVITIAASSYLVSPNPVDAGPSDKVFFLETDEDDITTITLGDGANGILPPIGQSVLASYKFGGGSEGNFPINAVNVLVDQLPGLLSVTNITEATGGGPKQSVESARRQIPKSLKANDRAITPEDFALFAERVTGVLKATGVNGVFSGAGREMLVFVVPEGGGTVSPTLANHVIAYVRPKKLAGKRVRVRSAVFVDLDIDADVYVNDTDFALATGDKVRNAYLTKYALDAAGSVFGAEYGIQDAYDAVLPSRLKGVKRVFLKRFTVKPYSARYVNKPTTGTGVVESIIVNADVKRREWNIVISATAPVPQFTVKQRRLGTITQITDTVITDESATYDPNELVGHDLLIRPEEQSTGFAVTANTSSTVSVVGGLLTLGEPDDPYVVEKTEPLTGKVLRTTASLTASGVTQLPVTSTTNWSPNDLMLIRSGTSTFVRRVVTVTPNDAAELVGSTDLTALVYGAGGSLDGEIFTVSINGGPDTTVTFVAPPDAAGVVNQINAVMSPQLVASLNGSNQLVLTTALENDTASVRIVAGSTVVGSSSLVDLGFTAGQMDVGGAQLGIDEAVSVVAGDTIDWYWRSADETVGFALVAGGTAFTVGDELYVDTYAQAGDIKLRPENFPLISAADLNVQAIGGVR